MASYWSLFSHGIKYGLVLSVLLMVFLLISQLINPEIMLNDYPPDVRQKYGSPKPGTMRQKTIASFIFLLIITLVLIGSFNAFTRPIEFVPAFLNLLIVFMTFNVIDLLVIDWLIFVMLQPRFIILPGTEGLPGYQDYRFHFRAFLIGTVVITLLSAVLAGGIVLIQTTV